jgi:hypothetical protein
VSIGANNDEWVVIFNYSSHSRADTIKLTIVIHLDVVSNECSRDLIVI